MNIGYNLGFWYEYGFKQAVEMDLRSHPNLLLTGSSGSGKSYALKWLIRNLLKNNVCLFFNNFKDSTDFHFLKGYPYYYVGNDCVSGVEMFYTLFKEKQASGTEFDGRYNILVFDEYPAFVLYESMLDKKQAEKYKMMLAELLMLCRSYGFGVWLIMQRPDASLLANGARDNFQTTVSLGNLSKEAKSMLYSGEDIPDRVYRVGEGIGWIDGNGLVEVKYPRILDVKKLEQDILTGLAVRSKGQTGQNAFT